MKKIELMKNIILGVLCGTIIVLVCAVIRLDIQLDEAERLLDEPSIRFPSIERPLRDYERADSPMRPFYELPRAKKKLRNTPRNMPMVPDVDYRIEQMLNLAAQEPSLFSDEEIVYLLIQ